MKGGVKLDDWVREEGIKGQIFENVLYERCLSDLVEMRGKEESFVLSFFRRMFYGFCFEEFLLPFILLCMIRSTGEKLVKVVEEN